MDTGSSGEDVVVKPRKPYTITKQRERWTEEEHNRFLEALKLYGRAWQKIEEHIGTKTAVQIRSHAQKFFTKLEKEASAKGIPLGQKLDIEIPPPRPKRKPSNPYPRKQCINSSPTSKEGKGETSSVSNCSSCPSKELNNFKKPISLEKLHRDQIIETSKKVHENGKYAEVLTLFQDTPCTSLNSVKDGSGNSLVFRELVPLLNEFKGDFLDNKRSSTDQEEDEPKQSCTLHTMVNDKLKDVSADLNPRAERADPSDILDKSKKVGVSIQNQQPGLQKSPGTSCLILQDNTDDGGHSQPSFCHLQNPTSLPDVQSQMHTNPFMNSSMFARPDFHPNAPNPPISQQLPSFPSVGLFNCNQDAYRSLLNMSSTFSNFVVSTLLQNPAAHAAATLAASLWHSFDTDKSKGSSLEVSNGNITSSQVSGHLSSPPSVAAIAAATVAAATAWWAMHGLVPFFHPVPNCYAFASASPPDLMTSPASDRKPDNIVDCIQIVAKQGVQPRDEESPDAQAVQGPMSKSLSSSDSDGTGGAEMSHVTQLKSSEVKELVLTTDTGLQESSSNMRIKSKPGHYFCGSVTVRHSSFEIEKAGTSKEQLDESQLTPRVSEAKARRSRSSGSCVNESRKVSEEGRLAFQALFSREVLPQTFSPPSEDDDLVHCDRGVDMAFSVDLNRKVSTDTEPDMMICQNGPALRNNDRVDSSFSTNGVSHSKLKVRKAGFKPYKRCSVEANVSRITGEEEKANKRAHMESKASN